jgi:hypothetical protein
MLGFASGLVGEVRFCVAIVMVAPAWNCHRAGRLVRAYSWHS